MRKIIRDICRINWPLRFIWLKGRIYHAICGLIIKLFYPNIWSLAIDTENLWCDIDPWGHSEEYEYLYFSGVSENWSGAVLCIAACLFRKDKDYFDGTDNDITDYIKVLDNQPELMNRAINIQMRMRNFYGIESEKQEQ